MADNKFATFLLRNSNQLAFHLIYAFLEWILILLLLLNSFFTYLIQKFASYFSLKPPCFFCSRVDRFFDPKNQSNSYKDFVCDTHAREISNLGFCLNLKELAESKQMSGNCFFSSPLDDDKFSVCLARKLDFLSWVKEKEAGRNEKLNHSLDDLSFTQKVDLIVKAVEDHNNGGILQLRESERKASHCSHEEIANEHQILSDADSLRSASILQFSEKEEEEDLKVSTGCFGEDDSAQLLNFSFENVSSFDGDRTIPIKIIDSSTMSNPCTEKQNPRENENLNGNPLESKKNDGELATMEEKNDEESPCYPDHSPENAGKAVEEETESSDDHLHKNIAVLEKGESGLEESLDGASLVSDMEGEDPIAAIERLKSALKSDQNALRALHRELEEERSASATATNQTMAMITRLQEEKASMKLEALQYQRMMEEQAEYDQEALQLLNELVLKREKEKRELEKELEMYRQRVLKYEEEEENEKMRTIASRNSYTFSSELNEVSVDLDREANVPAGVDSTEEMAVDCVKHMNTLDESLAEFEEERMSILDQLKALEEKLMKIENDEQFIENGNDSSLHNQETLSSMAKKLLPFLDEADKEIEEEEEDDEVGIEIKNSASIEEEVDRVYDRLDALEADRDFLRHCMSSIKKGDKGVDLLQEILQHLRDLRASDLQVGTIYG